MMTGWSVRRCLWLCLLTVAQQALADVAELKADVGVLGKLEGKDGDAVEALATLKSRMIWKFLARLVSNEAEPSFADDETHSATKWPLYDPVFVVPDIHGDFEAAASILASFGILNATTMQIQNWKGTLIQLGDVVDRGPDGPAAFELLWDLAREASPKKNRKVFQMIGNHEQLNLANDAHYISPEEFKTYHQLNAGLFKNGKFLYPRSIDSSRAGSSAEVLEETSVRKALERAKRISPDYVAPAWDPNHGVLGRSVLNTSRVYYQLGDVVFVHGGLVEPYAKVSGQTLYEQLRKDVLKANFSQFLIGERSPIWSRLISLGRDRDRACKLNDATMKARNATSQVVGHTITKSLTVEGICSQKFIMADCADSRYMNPRSTPRAIRITTPGSSDRRVLALGPKSASLLKSLDQSTIFNRRWSHHLSREIRFWEELVVTEMPLKPGAVGYKPGGTLKFEYELIKVDFICYEPGRQVQAQSDLESFEISRDTTVQTIQQLIEASISEAKERDGSSSDFASTPTTYHKVEFTKSAADYAMAVVLTAGRWVLSSAGNVFFQGKAWFSGDSDNGAT